MERLLRDLLPAGMFSGTPEARSRHMAAVRGKGNRTTERAVRAKLVALGVRGWVMHPHDLQGRPDFYFPDERIALFIDGCFWHGCTRCGHVPRTNSRFWSAKILRNRTRDRVVARALRNDGIAVLRIWEHAASRGDWLKRLAVLRAQRRGYA